MSDACPHEKIELNGSGWCCRDCGALCQRVDWYPPNETYLTVSRSLLAEALEQIEATHRDNEQGHCIACRTQYDSDEHRESCRYVRVRDALKGALK